MIRPFFRCEDGSVFMFISEDEIETTTLLGFMSAGIIMVSESFWGKNKKPLGCEILEDKILELSKVNPQPLLIFLMEYKYARKLVQRGVIPSPIVPIDAVSVKAKVFPAYFDTVLFPEMEEISKKAHSSIPSLVWENERLEPIILSKQKYQSIVESESGLKYICPIGFPDHVDDINRMN